MSFKTQEWVEHLQERLNEARAIADSHKLAIEKHELRPALSRTKLFGRAAPFKVQQRRELKQAIGTA